MEDAQIIDLFWARDEEAIAQTHIAYGQKLHCLSDRILHCREDAQECVSDTYMRAWNSIPPQRPSYLFAYLAKLCRNLSLSRLEWRQAAKRSANIVALTHEMEQCIPDRSHLRRLEGEALGSIIDRFLASLPVESRLIFMRRYWFADSVQEIALRFHITESKVKTQLHRTRKRMKQFLEREGVSV